jgi:hypothetical protein
LTQKSPKNNSSALRAKKSKRESNSRAKARKMNEKLKGLDGRTKKSARGENKEIGLKQEICEKLNVEALGSKSQKETKRTIENTAVDVEDDESVSESEANENSEDECVNQGEVDIEIGNSDELTIDIAQDKQVKNKRLTSTEKRPSKSRFVNNKIPSALSFNKGDIPRTGKSLAKIKTSRIASRL